MKKSFIGILAATIILSGCGTSQMAAGDPNAVLAGAAIGSNVGGAIGGHKHVSHSVSGIAASRSEHPWDGKCFPDHVVGGGSGTLGSRCDPSRRMV